MNYNTCRTINVQQGGILRSTTLALSLVLPHLGVGGTLGSVSGLVWRQRLECQLQRRQVRRHVVVAEQAGIGRGRG